EQHRRGPGRSRIGRARRGRDGSRSPRLAAEHDRDGSDRPPRRSGRGLDRRAAAGGSANAARPLPDRALYLADRTQSPRRHALLMSLATHLECSLTGERYEAGQAYNLSRAGKPLLVRYDLDAARQTLTRESLESREPGMWKWRELLPHDGDPISLGEPETPIVALPHTGGANLLVKDEGRLPTGSFKARGLAMAVTMAKQFGIERIAMPTNGNAGAALAAYGARAGIETIVICPAETPGINVTETAAYGARVYVADGQIDECGALVGKGAAEGLWFDCSTLKEPYRLEGKKVMGFELAEQFGWQLPDAIFYPTGGGTGLIGMWKAFDELEAVGLIGPKRPRMYSVQAEGCAPIVRAFEKGEEFAERWEHAATVATGIRVPKAVGDFLILRAVRESKGAA